MVVPSFSFDLFQICSKLKSEGGLLMNNLIRLDDVNEQVAQKYFSYITKKKIWGGVIYMKKMLTF